MLLPWLMRRQHLFGTEALDDSWDQWRWDSLGLVMNPASLPGLPTYIARVFGRVSPFHSSLVDAQYLRSHWFAVPGRLCLYDQLDMKAARHLAFDSTIGAASRHPAHNVVTRTFLALNCAPGVHYPRT